MSIIKHILDSGVRSGFKRILFFSGHGGITLAKKMIQEHVVIRSD